MAEMNPERKESISRALMLLSISIALCQLALFCILLGVPLSFNLSDYCRLAYFAGEILCVILAIPFAAASLTLSAEGKGGRSALVLSIGVAAICGFFMIFPR